MGMFCLGFSILIMGPTNLFNFPDTWWMVTIGIALLGVFQIPIFVAIISEMLERFQIALDVP